MDYIVSEILRWWDSCEQHLKGTFGYCIISDNKIVNYCICGFVYEKILNYYLQFSTYTNPGCYVDFMKSLSDDISDLGNLVCYQVIHRVTLKNGNTNANSEKKYGDMDKYPWHRLRCDDADGFFDRLNFSQFDIPDNKFDWAAKTWLDIRAGKQDSNKFVYAGGQNGLKAVIRAIFYDFHSLMNNEISYNFQPSYISGKFDLLTETEFKEIDNLAKLMLEPDKNFRRLVEIWNDV